MAVRQVLPTSSEVVCIGCLVLIEATAHSSSCAYATVIGRIGGYLAHSRQLITLAATNPLSSLALPLAIRRHVTQYKVKDIAEADFGRLEIEMAEAEMPGLMACRAEFGPQQPFKGVKVRGVANTQ
jgi:hypothetical protein